MRVDGTERARGRRSCRYVAYGCGPLSWVFFCSAPVPGSRVVPLGLTPGYWPGAVTQARIAAAAVVQTDSMAAFVSGLSRPRRG